MEHPQGNILNIGDVTPSHDGSAVPRPRKTDEQKRRDRMERGADEAMTSTEEEVPVHHGSGGTGADMGSGGDGTDIE
ncbi:MAG TPA: hypothetical protein VGL62_03420 [Vicinamibacterales bacterium]|jgi:hypothetical protein